MKIKIKAKEVEKNSIESQTESEFQDYYCQHCIYVASCVDELEWHIENAHADEEPFDIDLQNCQIIIVTACCVFRRNMDAFNADAQLLAYISDFGLNSSKLFCLIFYSDLVWGIQ